MKIVKLTIYTCMDCPFHIQVWNTKACKHRSIRRIFHDENKYPISSRARRIPSIKIGVFDAWPIPEWCPIAEEMKNESHN